MWDLLVLVEQSELFVLGFFNAGSDDGEGVGSKGNADSTGAADFSKSTIIENNNVISNIDVEISDMNHVSASKPHIVPPHVMSPDESEPMSQGQTEPLAQIENNH